MRRALLAALAAVGCLGDPAPYRCDLRGGDRACDLVSGAVCVDRYCAEPVSNALCASGFRYTASAAAPGACAAPRDAAADPVDTAVTDAATDAPALEASFDAPAPDLPGDRPVADRIDAGSLPDDAPADARDAPAVDVIATRDVADEQARIDVVNGVDVVDVVDARDATDVTDAPVIPLPECGAGPRIVSPLPNERVFGARIAVRTEGASTFTQLLSAQGIDCRDAVTTTPLTAGGAIINANPRGYLCLALLDSLTGGAPCATRWRRIATLPSAGAGGARAPQGSIWPDFNNDGWADLLMATQEGLRVQSFASTHSFGSGPSPESPPNGAAVALAAVGDVDGDGYGDAVASWDIAPMRTLLLYRGGPMGLTRTPVTVVSRVAAIDPSFARRLFGLGDLDGDGRTEFAHLDLVSRALTVWSVDATRGLRVSNSLGVANEIRAVAAGADLTGDGLSDVAISYGGQVRVFPGGGGGAHDIVPGVMHASFADVMAAGVDGDDDGVSELVVRNGMSGALQIYRFVAGGFVRETRTAGSATDAATLLAPGDMDDARPDELVVLDAAGQVRVRPGGAMSDLSGSYPWSAVAGALVAGTSSPEVRGRIWYARSQSLTRHGIEILGLSNGGFTSLLADGLYPSAVRLIAR